MSESLGPSGALLPMLMDLRFALRMIRTHRWFSAAVIVTLALGIGINSTVFTLVNAVLFKPVPIPGGERIVTVEHQNLTDPERRSGVAYPDFQEYRAGNRSFEGLEAFAFGQAILSEPGNPPDRFQIARASSGLFRLIRTAPIVGRGFSPDDGKPGAEPVLLLGHRVWQSRYAGSADVVGRSVRVNGVATTIIGVMPEGFRFPSNEDGWMPLVPDAGLENRTDRSLVLFGMLKPGTTVAAAQADLAVISSRLAAQFPDTNKELGALVRTFHQTYNGDQIRLVFLMMFGAVGFVLLIACANVANMMLGRAITRSREIAVRAAMGATRWQLVRQLLVESVLLSSLGGVVGLGLAWSGARAFDLATRNVGRPYWIDFSMDWRALVYFAAISFASGIVFGLVPALRASRVDLNTAMKDGTLASGSQRGGRFTAALVVVQFALTMVLLAGAGMMIRGFFAVQALNPFVPAEHVFTARIQLPEGKGEHYAQPAVRRQFYERLLPELGALPGVAQVAATSFLPGLGSNSRDIEIESAPVPDPKQRPRASFIVQTPGYLEAIRLPILLGRGFGETDGDPGKEAAVVTRAFAAKYWPQETAVGKRFRFVQNDQPESWLTVIGISADLVQNAQRHDTPPLVFIPYRQEPWGWMALLLRTRSDPAVLAAPVRVAVQRIDQDLPLFEVQTLSGARDRQTWFLRVFGIVFLVFALVGLLMAAVGIYGVIAQTTARRTREIGIRIALGATAGAIARLVLSRGVVQLTAGLALGLLGGLAVTNLMGKGELLIQVSAYDPVVFVSIAALLAATGLFACWLPARRAARIAPVEALRTG